MNIEDIKIICFGDIHGREIWRDVVDSIGIDNVDLVIFLGDYFTSREGITVNKQWENFENIMSFKEKYSDKVILLRGNHDMEALGYNWASCSPSYAGRQVKENEEKFLSLTQWLYQIDNIIFSHAGITEYWYEKMCEAFPEIKCFMDINKIEPCEYFGFTPSKFSDYCGTSPSQPLTWVRPATLCEYGYPEITYVVGHTTQPHIINAKAEILKYEKDPNFAKCDIWMCDTLPREYLFIDHGQFKPIQIEK